MTWNPESTQRVEQVNLTGTIASRKNPATGLGALQNKFKTSDGNTYGEWEFPEVAPLVFPALDQLAAQTSEDGVKKKTKTGKGLTFVANYWDKRATAEYVSFESTVITRTRHPPALDLTVLLLLIKLAWKGYEKSR